MSNFGTKYFLCLWQYICLTLWIGSEEVKPSCEIEFERWPQQKRKSHTTTHCTSTFASIFWAMPVPTQSAGENQQGINTETPALPAITRQDIINCAFSSWYKRFENVTFESRTISLPETFIDYLNADGIYLPDDGYGLCICMLLFAVLFLCWLRTSVNHGLHTLKKFLMMKTAFQKAETKIPPKYK